MSVLAGTSGHLHGRGAVVSSVGHRFVPLPGVDGCLPRTVGDCGVLLLRRYVQAAYTAAEFGAVTEAQS